MVEEVATIPLQARPFARHDTCLTDTDCMERDGGCAKGVIWIFQVSVDQLAGFVEPFKEGKFYPS